MGFSDILFHVGGFLLPALALGLLLPLAGRLVVRQEPIVSGFWRQAAIGTVTGVIVLVAGLWFFGQDGKMATYGALVAVTATIQWGLSGAWRR